MLSPSVCLWSVTITFVRSAKPVEIFGIFLCHLAPWPSSDMHGKFYGGRPRGTPPWWELNAREVAKYSDFDLSKAIGLSRINGARQEIG